MGSSHHIHSWPTGSKSKRLSQPPLKFTKTPGTQENYYDYILITITSDYTLMTKDILSEQINEETYEVGSGRVHDIASPVPSPHGISKCHAVCMPLFNQVAPLSFRIQGFYWDIFLAVWVIESLTMRFNSVSSPIPLPKRWSWFKASNLLSPWVDTISISADQPPPE